MLITLVSVISFSDQLVFHPLQLLFQTLSDLPANPFTPSHSTENLGFSFIETTGALREITSHVVDIKDASSPLTVALLYLFPLSTIEEFSFLLLRSVLQFVCCVPSPLVIPGT